VKHTGFLFRTKLYLN